jgi:hypothetical protein
LTQMQDQKKYQVVWMVISKEIERWQIWYCELKSIVYIENYNINVFFLLEKGYFIKLKSFFMRTLGLNVNVDDI